MNKFNLTFSGKILAGHDPARVKVRFGRMFGIEDPERLERFFSGETIILRRNLERKAAGQYYRDLQVLGVVAALVKVTTSDFANAIANTPKSHVKKAPDTARHDKSDSATQPAAGKAESPQQEAETAAMDNALLLEQARQQAKKAARRKAELEAKKRQEAENTARLLAEDEEQRRREAEEAARLQQALEAIKRQEAEEAARLQAELDEIKRQEVEAAARVKAEAQRKQEEARRESAERRRAAADKVASQRALRKEEKRKAAATQAEQKAQKALQLRQQAEEIARRKSEQLNREAQERLEQAALSAALQEKAVQRAAAELAQQTAIKPTKARVKTRLETPQRKTGQALKAGAPHQRKRQAGEPNLYALRPFRNTEEVRGRAEQSRRRMRLSYKIGVLGLAALLLAGVNFVQRIPDPVITGTEALAVDPQHGPLLLAGNTLLFHDRAGNSTKQVTLSALGISQLEPPLAFDGAGALLGLGRLNSDSTEAAGGNVLHLLRCELEVSRCQHFSPELDDSDISTFVIHPLEGSLLLVDGSIKQLLKVNRAGEIVARATAPVPSHPVLRLHGGLLLMNSADGPGISVLRYEDSAFGEQLDEILLLPPAAQKAGQSRVGDFLWSGNAWWASMLNPESGSIGLYRFDKEWNYLDKIALPVDSGLPQLASWGEKTLVGDPGRPVLQRFSAQGAVEAPFVPTQLADLIDERRRQASLTTLAWLGGLLACALTAVLGLGIGYLQNLRSLVYKQQREQGAEPIDDYTETLLWIAPLENHQALLQRSGYHYGLLVSGILMLAIGQSVTTWQLTALLLALSGPAIALLLSRRPPGHIGIVQDKLLLVDHSGMYHLAGGARVQYCGPFLMIDDVVVFCGSSIFPVFPYLQIKKLVSPLALGGIKVDRNTLLVKLLQSRHPLAQGALAIVATATAAATLLCLQGIF